MLQKHRQVALLQGIVLLRIAHHRLNRQLLKSQIRHVQHIGGKVRIEVGIGAPHIVVLLPSGVCKPLEFIQDQIITALAVAAHPQPVMGNLAPVQRQHHIAHLPVGKVDHIIVDQQAVGGKGKAKVLIMELLLFPAIGHQPLAHIPVQQGLTAKEVHFQIPAAGTVGNEIIQCLLAHFIGHDLTLAVVLSLAGKAVFARQVAIVGNMQANGLQYPLAAFELVGNRLKGILGKQPSVGDQRLNVFKTKINIRVRYIRLILVFF